MGMPVVTTVHHPLTVDRRASFIRDENLTEAIGTMQFYPIGMQAFVARRLERVLTSSRRAPSGSCRLRRVAERITNVGTGSTPTSSRPDPSGRSRAARGRDPVRGPGLGPEQGRGGPSSRPSPGCRADVRLTWSTTPPRARRRSGPANSAVGSACTSQAGSPPRNWCGSTGARRSWWCPRASRASASRPSRPWPAERAGRGDRRRGPARGGRCRRAAGITVPKSTTPPPSPRPIGTLLDAARRRAHASASAPAPGWSSRPTPGRASPRATAQVYREVARAAD